MRWIRSVRLNGECAVGQYIILRYQKGAGLSSEAAFIVSKRIGRAVTRNRIKRRLREIFRNSIQPGAESGRYVFIARTGSAQALYQQLNKDMNDLVKRIR